MYLPASQGAGFLFHQSQLNAFVTFAATLSGDVITYGSLSRSTDDLEFHNH